MDLEKIERVALKEPVTVEVEVKRWGSGGAHFYISKEHLSMNSVTAGVFEITEIPLTLNRIKDNEFSIPQVHVRAAQYRILRFNRGKGPRSDYPEKTIDSH